MTNYKHLIILFSIFISIISFGQDRLNLRRFYVSINSFKENYQPKDSLGFMIKNNDTLIQVINRKIPKGVGVPYEYKDSTFLKIYKKIAFKSIHKDSTNTKPMKYWKNEIKIYFSNSISKSIIKDVMKFANRVDYEVDSLTISKVKTLEDSNFVIYYDTDYEYISALKNQNHSEYWISWNGRNQIERGYIRIKKDQMFSEKLTKYQIKKLFFGSLGWFNWNDDLSCNSYFSNCYSDNKQLSLLDLELLKYHYSYGICKGTRLKTFENQHKRSKEALLKKNSHVLFYHDE